MSHLSRFPWLTLAAMALAATVHAGPVDWSAFNKSFEISFPGYTSTETLTDFPVLVRLSVARNAFQYNKCRQPNGGDLRFSDAEGNLLSHEIDTWNQDGESLVWVKVPSLNANTVITAYYGCANPVAVTPSDVWSNGYLGVWHMGESASPLEASTPGSVAFSTFTAGVYETINGIQWAQTGIVGGATKFGPDAIYTNSILRTTAADASAYEGMNALTVEAWACRDTDAQNTGYILDMTQHTGNNWSWRFYDYKQSGVAKVFCTICTTNGTDIRLSGSTVPANEWTYRAFTYDSQIENAHNFFLYVNGVKSVSKEDGGGSPVKATGTGRLYLGNDLSYNHYTDPYPGRIDEVRISNVARSADWVKATYDAVNNDSFAAYRVSNDWKRYAHTFSVSFPGATNGVLSAFPVLVKISTNDIPNFRYADCLKENGGDLRFADENGNLLDCEVDTWDTNGVSLVWVNVPSLTSGTTIKAYYGWDFAPSVEAMNVWTNGYLGVWHLNEASSPLADATGGGKNFTRSSSHVDMVSLGGAGLLGNAPEFAMTTNQDGTHDGYLSFKDSGNKFIGTTMTFEMWTYQKEDRATNRRLLYKKDKDLAFDFNLQYDSKNVRSTLTFSFVATNMLDNVSLVTNSVRARYKEEGINVWRHYALVYDSVDAQRLLAYVNGANSGSSDDSVALNQGYSVLPSGGSIYLGNLSSKRAFPGMIDEVRISNVARSAGWLATTYDMIQGNADFATYSSAKENSEGTIVIFR